MPSSLLSLEFSYGRTLLFGCIVCKPSSRELPSRASGDTRRLNHARQSRCGGGRGGDGRRGATVAFVAVSDFGVSRTPRDSFNTARLRRFASFSRSKLSL